MVCPPLTDPDGEFWGPGDQTVSRMAEVSGSPGWAHCPSGSWTPCATGRGQAPLQRGTHGQDSCSGLRMLQNPAALHPPGCLPSPAVGRVQEAGASAGRVRLTDSCQGHSQRSRGRAWNPQVKSSSQGAWVQECCPAERCSWGLTWLPCK